MTLSAINLLRCELDASLDEAGFRHAVTAFGERIGGARIGAAVYQAVADHPIWPYHYHYPAEEWLYVLGGAPVLRDPAGRRPLRPGDLICFPAGHRGAHTLYGPGRFVILSTRSPGPWVSVYPDSDKISVVPGPDEAAGLNSLRLPRAGHVDYWYGEGPADPPPAAVVREPNDAPSQPVLNLLAEPVPDGAVALSPRLGGSRLDVTLIELRPGLEAGPWHYTQGREEWVLVLSGVPALRHAHGERQLTAGEVTCFPDGPAGVHQMANRTDETVRALAFATTGWPAHVHEPDTGAWTLLSGPGDAPITLG